jgi:exopolyphosphatase/guanosine-5'-triphosphate,3'-diphosphate pyrophosphatase
VRVAGIDCGTNSIRLLVADVAPDGSLSELVRDMKIVRLGQDVDRTGRLAPEAIERTRVALADYAATIRELQADRVRMAATSASRDATNRDDFVEMVRTTLGHDPEVITGDEEARLSFSGAAGTLPGLSGEVLVADIGGGSTELIVGDAVGGGLLGARSMDIGSVRMTERHLRDDPPTRAQIQAVVEDVRAAVAGAQRDVPIQSATAFIGVAGTVTTVAAVALGLTEYRSDLVHNSRLSAGTVADVADMLLRSTHDQRAAIPAIHPGRVDVIGAGALILRTLVEITAVTEVIVSEHDILDGIALSIAAG